MADEKLYWGDFHYNIHSRNIERIEEIFDQARANLDFLPVAYYPFEFGLNNGMPVEFTLPEATRDSDWRAVERACAKFNEPGRFVTFPGYEWHGDRRRWGDHNVFYPSEGYPLDGTWDLPDLAAKLRQRGALAIPHHTAYRVGNRGKDWDFHDPRVSPVVEVYSSHGSSEGTATPVPMHGNADMGPRTSGGSWMEGLARGYRLGAIGSTDAHGDYAGVWGSGLAGVWAGELSRKALWEAVRARRTYAVTGDRIRLDIRCGDAVMGGETRSVGPPQIEVSVDALDAIDRIELIRDGVPVNAYVHDKRWMGRVPSADEVVRVKVRVLCGWGPREDYGVSGGYRWDLRLVLSQGEILGMWPCFVAKGQRIQRAEGTEAVWHHVVPVRSRATRVPCQAVVVELRALAGAPVEVVANGRALSFNLAEALAGSRLEVYDREARDLVREQFGLEPGEVPDPERIEFISPKLKIGRASPGEAYRTTVTLTDEEADRGEHCYYVRVFQMNGQAAWSSPIWVDVVA